MAGFRGRLGRQGGIAEAEAGETYESSEEGVDVVSLVSDRQVFGPVVGRCGR
jgi:hypothetical protein